MTTTTSTSHRALVPAMTLAAGVAMACFGMGALWRSQQPAVAPPTPQPTRPTLGLSLGEVVQRFNAASAKHDGPLALEEKAKRSQINQRTWRVAYALTPSLQLLIDTDDKTRAPVSVAIMGIATGAPLHGVQTIGAVVAIGQAAFGPGDNATGELVELCNSSNKAAAPSIKGLQVACSIAGGLTVASISAPEPPASRQ